MSHQPTLQEFIDDELMRAPMTLDRAIDAVHERWRLLSPGGSGRQDHRGDRVLQQHRGEVVATALKRLRQAGDDELRLQRQGDRVGAPAPGRRELSLIEDDDVAVDIEIARAIELAKTQAEAELRELQTYTSALVGDHNVARDTNPFRPEVMVRALWHGVQQLPLSRAAQAAFLRDAAQPLAEALRLAYGGAVARLQDQGVEPAAHRTIVFHGTGTAWGARLPRHLPPDELGALHQTVDTRPPQPLSPLTPLPLQPLPGQTEPPQAPQPPAGTPAAGDLLPRLFEAMVRDDALPLELLPLVRRLQPVASALALRDPTLLVIYVHPLWRFLDRLAHQVLTASAAEQARVLGLARNLVDHLAAEPAVDGSRFEWASERLKAARRHAFDQALANAAAMIDKLQRIARADAAPTTSTMPLDLGSLDTVPADLLPAPPAPSAAPAAPHLELDQAEPGSHWRAWLQGDWRRLQLLWHDEPLGLWLLREPATERHWALRQAALDQLAAERLLQPLRRRSLVKRAASRLQAAGSPARPG